LKSKSLSNVRTKDDQYRQSAGKTSTNPQQMKIPETGLAIYLGEGVPVAE
jgi:hypothetical protein